jgi:hypothetical protein
MTPGDGSVLVRDETSFGIGLKESFPIFPGLIPSCGVLQAHSSRDVAGGHRPDLRGGVVAQLFLDLSQSTLYWIRILLFRKDALDFFDAQPGAIKR